MDNNKSIAVIYKSKYGSTKKYAGWIALKLDADLYEISDIRGKDLKDYDVIIFGGSLHAGRIKGVDLITKNYDMIKEKEIIVFTVGLSSEEDKLLNSIMEKNFDEEIGNNIKLFYLRGSFNYRELSIGDKAMMSILKIDLKSKKDELDEDGKGMLEAFNAPIDFCDKKSIEKVIICVNENI